MRTKNMPVKTIDPIEVQKLIDAGYKLDIVDVRTPAEYRSVHATGSSNKPLDELDCEAIKGDRDPNGEPVYFICRSDSRGKKACEAMISSGFPNVVNVAGGIVAWDDLGLPVVRGKQTISLDRQVRTAAGLLVLLGIVLGWAVHPALYGLAAFVGVGLTYSGLTDSCGMAMVLSKMPWNQVKPEPNAE